MCRQLVAPFKSWVLNYLIIQSFNYIITKLFTLQLLLGGNLDYGGEDTVGSFSVDTWRKVNLINNCCKLTGWSPSCFSEGILLATRSHCIYRWVASHGHVHTRIQEITKFMIKLRGRKKNKIHEIFVKIVQRFTRPHFIFCPCEIRAK